MHVFSSTKIPFSFSLDFFSGAHGSDEPFDGTGGVLAHAFFPTWGGDVHFDNAEKWLDEKRKRQAQRDFSAKQLLQTAVHEIGHSLGLKHSESHSAIMAPFYRGWLDSVELSQDDVNGIQAIYGRKRGTTTVSKPSKPTRPKPSTTTTPRPPKRPTFKPFRPGPTKGICADQAAFDAAAMTADGSYYVFRGNQYWKLKLDDAGVYDGYPRPISDWRGLPSSGVDAAFYNPNDRMTYFFAGHKVHKFLNKKAQRGYPKPVSAAFPGAPIDGGFDAALLWGKNEQLYLFKGALYWKFDFSKKRVGPRYPKSISREWIGVPTNLGAALRWTNGKSYFFRGGNYYRFDDDALTVDRSTGLSYPRPTGKWWFGCKGNSGNGHSSSYSTNQPNIVMVTGENGRRQPRWQWSD